jgi:hypothetical protein
VRYVQGLGTHATLLLDGEHSSSFFGVRMQTFAKLYLSTTHVLMSEEHSWAKNLGNELIICMPGKRP